MAKTTTKKKKRTAAAKTARKKAGKSKATRKTQTKRGVKKVAKTRASRAKSGSTAAKRTKKKTARKVVKTSTRKRATAARPETAARTARETAMRKIAVDRLTIASRPTKPLAQREVEEFRQMLLRKRAEIIGDVSTLQGEALDTNRQDASGDLSSMPIHMADLGSDNYELEFTLGLIEGERAILKEIDEALDRIREGTYGRCQATGNPIGKARLRAKPWAKYCYEYTLAQEKGQTGGF